jgi:serine/threonine-protein kinase
MSVDRVSRILSSQPEVPGEWSRKSDNNHPAHAGSQTSTAWTESQGIKRPSAVPAQGTTGGAPKAGTDPAITSPPVASKTGRNMAIGVGVAGLLLIGVFAMLNGQKASAAAAANAAAAAANMPPPATAVDPANARLTAVKIAATPPEAKVYIDDTLVSGNPATAKFRTDGASHALRVEAPGFVSQRQMVAFDKESVDLSLTLAPEPVADPTAKKPIVGGGAKVAGPAVGPKTKKGGSAIDTNNPYP